MWLVLVSLTKQTLTTKGKSVDGVLGIRVLDGMMVGADESIEL